jgi:hypothetical protein
LGRKRNILTERINSIGQPLARDSGNHRTDLVDILLLVTIRFRRQGVCTEKAGDHIDLPLLRQPARGSQHPHLGFRIEAIARLDLDGRDAFCQQAVKPRQACTHEIILTGRTCRLHRRDDATARPRNVFI